MSRLKDLIIVDGLSNGLVADGATDDGPTINRVWQEMAALGGGTYRLPPGRTVAIGTTLQQPSNIRVLGGPGGKLLALAGLNGDVLTNADHTNGNTGIVIRNLLIDGGRSGQTAGSGIHLVKCDDAVIDGVTVQNCYAHGIYLDTCKRPDLGIRLTKNGAHGLYLPSSPYDRGEIAAWDNGQGAYAAPAAPTATVQAQAGNVDVGTHVYAVTFVNVLGETVAGTISSTVTTSTGNQQVALTNIPLGPSGPLATTARKVYRSKAGTSTPLYLLATLSDNTTTTYTDNTADASLGAQPPSANTTGGVGVALDGSTTDAAAALIAYDDQGTQTQVYGVWEVPSSSCDRNSIFGRCHGNLIAASSFVGSSSKLVDTTAVVASAGLPVTQTTTVAASLGVNVNAAPLDHAHAAPAGLPVALSTNAVATTGATGRFSDAGHVHPTPGSVQNLLVNGGFEIWQRGNGPFTGNNTYTADRWYISLVSTATVSVTKDTTNVDSGSGASASCSVTTNGNAAYLLQKLETTMPAAGFGVKMTLSVRVKAPAAAAIELIMWDASISNWVFSQPNVGTGWETLTLTANIAQAAGNSQGMGVLFLKDGLFNIDNAMLVIGSVAVNYTPLDMAMEWERCQRYYEAGQFALTGYNATGQPVFTPRSFLTRKALSNPTVTMTVSMTSNLTALAFDASSITATDFTATANIVSTGAGRMEINFTAEADP